MNCEDANQVDLVDYLQSLGYQPIKIRNNDHWYLSPLRNEKHASFKVSRSKNLWYDHGTGEGGTLIDFVMKYHNCDVGRALQIVFSFHPQNNFQVIPNDPPLPAHKHFVSQVKTGATETAIKVIAAKKPVLDHRLCRYLIDRRINKEVSDEYCFEVVFTNAGEKKNYTALGFKNNAGGYELRNEYFKGSSSPKDITYLDNIGNELTVFEGFFDFMSYQTLNLNQQNTGTTDEQPMNFLILNSLSFFEKSLPLIERHDKVHLYLDDDTAGRKFTTMALGRSSRFQDESKLYEGYKDLNDWMMNFGKLQKKPRVAKSRRHRL